MGKYTKEKLMKILITLIILMVAGILFLLFPFANILLKIFLSLWLASIIVFGVALFSYVLYYKYKEKK